LRWFTEKRDKYRAFNVQEEKEEVQVEPEVVVEEPVVEAKRKNVKIKQDIDSEAASKRSKMSKMTV
jgi:hypothetical protein